MSENNFYRAKYILNSKEKSEDFYMSNAQQVRMELSGRGIIPISVQKINVYWWDNDPISMDYKVSFLEAIRFHVKTGKSPSKAIKIIAEGEENHNVRQRLERAQEVVSRSGNFSEALEVLNFYPTAVISLLSVGEKTGTLSESITMALDYLKETTSTNKGLISSGIMFGFEFFVGLSAAFGVQSIFLPSIREQLAGGKDPEKVAEMMSKLDLAFMLNGGLIWSGVLLLITFIMLFVFLKLGSKELKLYAATVISKIPGVRSVIYDGEFYIAFSLISKMLSKGVSFPESVRTCKQTSKMPDIVALWDSVLDRINSGYTIAYSMNSKGYFTKPEIIALREHQDAKQLREVFDVMGDQRRINALKGKKRTVLIGLGIAFGYSIVSALIALWALTLQSQGMSLSLG